MSRVSLKQEHYPVDAKKNLANFSVVLDTPEYKRVTELKTHMSNVSHLPQTHFRWLPVSCFYST